jgi:hypothetical protein
MNELKSIKLFSLSIDNKFIKATLYQLDTSNFKVNIDLNSKIYTYQYNNDLYPNQKKNSFIRLVNSNIEDSNLINGFNLNNLTSYDYFLNDSILTLSKQLNIKFSIIEDPWIDTSKKRNYGFDPYYLNNSSVVYINWFVGNDKVGGYEWSDSNGNEIDYINFKSDKENITKKVYIVSPDSKKFTINQSNKISDLLSNSKIYPYNANDLFIVSEVIRLWKLNINNYNLERCSILPCNEIDYINPISYDLNNTSKQESIENKTISVNFIDTNIKSRSYLKLVLKII